MLPMINRLNQLAFPLSNKTGWPWTKASDLLPEHMPDKSPWPKISVVTPSYKQAQFVEKTIRSVLLQNYPNLEYIIIDGGSTDGSVEIIKRYEPWLAYWVSEPDRGQSHAINKGIKRSTGEVLFWLNSDDLCLPNTFACVINTRNKNPKYKLFTGQAKIIDQDSSVIGELRSFFTTWEDVATKRQNSIRQVSTFFSRDLFTKLGMVNETLEIAMDKDLLLRFTKFFPPLILDQYFAAFRIHENAKSQNMLLKGGKESDLICPEILQTKSLINAYKRDSAKKWLYYAKSDRFNMYERINCIFDAIGQYPLIVLTKSFWYSLFRILINIFKT